MPAITIKPLNDQQLEVLGNSFAACNIKLNGTFGNGFAFSNHRVSGTVVFASRRLQVYVGQINAKFVDGSEQKVPFRCLLGVVADIVDKLRK